MKLPGRTLMPCRNQVTPINTSNVPDDASPEYARRNSSHHNTVARIVLYEAALRLPAALLGPGGAGARAGHHQPGLLAARSADLPPRDRRVRHALPGVHDRRSSSAASACCSAPRSASRSSRASPRTSRTTSSTSSRSGSARSSTPTASATRSSCPTRCSRTSGAARRSASCRRCAPTSRSSSRPSINVAVHVARRHRLRDDLRVQRALADRAGLLPDRAAPRRAQLGAEPQDQDRSRR